MNYSTPLVSVIIPTYNRAHLVAKAISSVLNQTFSDFELIVVDDASEDETAHVVNTFLDPRIKFLRHEENRGGAAARNTGIRAANGKYFAFLDSDDEWLPQKLDKQVMLLNEYKDIGAVYCGAIFIDENKGKSRVWMPTAKGDIYKAELRYNPVGSASKVVVRRSCFERVGLFDENLPSAQDWDMWIRIAKHYLFDYVPEALVIYREHNNSITADVDATIAGRKILWHKHGLLDSRDLRSLHFFRLGHTLAYRGYMDVARSWLWKAVKSEPWRVQYLLALTLSILGAKLYHQVTYAILRSKFISPEL